MKTAKRIFLAVVLSLAALSAQASDSSLDPVKKEYFWVRSDGDVFVLKWKIDSSNRLTVIEKYTSSATSSALLPQPAGAQGIVARDYFDPCTVLDDQNWFCRTVTSHESIGMFGGVLIHEYWGTRRIYKTRLEEQRTKAETKEEPALGTYRQSAVRTVMQHMRYPRIAVMRKWQGTAVVEMKLSADGDVIQIVVAETSGYEVLDDAALKMVRSSLPLPKPPQGVRTITVPVVFRLQGAAPVN